MPWSATDAKSQNENPLRGRRFISSPAIIVDLQDRILMWYLPGIMAPARVVSSMSKLSYVPIIIDRDNTEPSKFGQHTSYEFARIVGLSW